MMKQLMALSLENNIVSSVYIMKKSTAMNEPRISCEIALKTNDSELQVTFYMQNAHEVSVFGSLTLNLLSLLREPM